MNKLLITSHYKENTSPIQLLQEKHITMLTTDIGGTIEPNLEVVDGDSIHLGGDITLKVIETPGHSNRFCNICIGWIKLVICCGCSSNVWRF